MKMCASRKHAANSPPLRGARGLLKDYVMPKAYFVVRSVVEPPLRQRFDQWYSSHHLPMALSEFKAERCWRFWSALDAGVHDAAYQFGDMAKRRAVSSRSPGEVSKKGCTRNGSMFC
jgi:hypothetical protein